MIKPTTNLDSAYIYYGNFIKITENIRYQSFFKNTLLFLTNRYILAKLLNRKTISKHLIKFRPDWPNKYPEEIENGRSAGILKMAENAGKFWPNNTNIIKVFQEA